MRRKISGIVLGLALIAGGLLYALSVLGIIDYSFSFEGWWTLFIIIPCLVSMIGDGIGVFNTAGLGIGILLLLSEQDIIKHSVGYKLIVPLVIVIVGLRLIFRRKVTLPDTVKQKIRSSGGNDFYAVFGGNTPQFAGQSFNGCNCYAIFGGVELNLRNAVINEDCVIHSYSIFGGTDISLPPNVRVVIDCTPVFGGIENKFISSDDPAAPTVYINAVCVFGGTDVK